MKADSKFYEPTREALADLRSGDRFCEMYSWWVYVLLIDKGEIFAWIGSGHPSEFPDGSHNGEYKIFKSLEEFKAALEVNAAYLCDRGNDVSKFIAPMLKQQISAGGSHE